MLALLLPLSLPMGATLSYALAAWRINRRFPMDRKKTTKIIQWCPKKCGRHEHKGPCGEGASGSDNVQEDGDFADQDMLTDVGHIAALEGEERHEASMKYYKGYREEHDPEYKAKRAHLGAIRDARNKARRGYNSHQFPQLRLGVALLAILPFFGEFALLAVLASVFLYLIADFMHYHQPRILPDNIKAVVWTNENFGFVAALVTGTNDVYSFALPMPSTITLGKQTIILHALEIIKIGANGPSLGTVIENLDVYFQMLRRDFTVVGPSDGLADAHDESMKATFAGPMFIGERIGGNVPTANTQQQWVEMDGDRNAMWWSPNKKGLRLNRPLIIHLVNRSTVITLATGAAADATFSNFEQVMLRAWYVPSNLSKKERTMWTGYTGLYLGS